MKKNRLPTKTLASTVFALLLIITALSVLSSLEIGGLHSFVVKTGSMAPKIGTGSLVFTRQTGDYRVGDVITYKALSGSDKTTTHRIVEVQQIDGIENYRLMGDANQTPDPFLVPKNNVIGEVFLAIPLIGYLTEAVKTPVGLIFLIVIPATIIIYEDIKSIRRELARLHPRNKTT